ACAYGLAKPTVLTAVNADVQTFFRVRAFPYATRMIFVFTLSTNLQFHNQSPNCRYFSIVCFADVLP
ncbi:hypothetical protein VSK70_27325, partial [Bacillus sp. WOD8 KX774193]|uniref:hypothetical protein n=1 Tax=Bacillus sp. WOD8 KX774193 TaxID=3096776 RepID=UPI002DBB6B2D